jgi:hypothetical protein
VQEPHWREGLSSASIGEPQPSVKGLNWGR